MDYMVLYAETVYELVEKVDLWVEPGNGWRPQGGFSATVDKDGKFWSFQAIVKMDD